MAGEPRATPRPQLRFELSLRRKVHFRAGEVRLYSASNAVLLGRRPMLSCCFLLQFELLASISIPISNRPKYQDEYRFGILTNGHGHGMGPFGRYVL